MGSTTIVAAIINIVINFIFIPKFGIYAAVFSTLISNIIIYWYRRQKLKMYINLKGKFNYIFWILLALTLFTYYKNNMIINILMFVLVLAYCIFTNKSFIGRILRPIVNKLRSKDNEKTNLDRIIGETAIVTEDIKKNVVGEVKVDGKRWSAVSKEKCLKGDTVKVLKIDGVKLIVEKESEK